MKAVLWGYSFWNAYVRYSGYSSNEASGMSDFENAEGVFSSWNKESKWGKLLSWSGKSGTQIDWNWFYPKLENPDPPEITTGKVFKIAPGTFAFSGYAPNREDLFVAWAKKAGPLNSALQGAADIDCEMKDAERELNEALSNLLSFSESVWIYLTPVTPLRSGDGPPCFLPAVKRMLERKRSDRVHVKTEDWGAYGLKYSDYIHPSTETAYAYQIDPNHVNWNGARKVTAGLLKWISKEKK